MTGARPTESPGTAGVRWLLGLAGGLVVLGSLLEVGAVSAVGVLIFATVAGVALVGDVLADDAGATPVVTSEPTRVAGVVVATAGAAAAALVGGFRALAILGALVVLAVGGVIVLSWALGPESLAGGDRQQS